MRHRGVVGAAKALLDPSQWATPSIVSGIVTGLALPAVFALLQERLGLIGVVLISLVIAVMLALFNWALGKFRGVRIEPPRPVAPKPALIVLVSSGKLDEIPALAAIRYHFRGEHDEREHPTLRYLWLMCSVEPQEEPKPPSQSSYRNAVDLLNMFRPHLAHVEKVEIIDIDNPAHVFNQAQYVYQEAARLRLAPSDLVADITGGTKSMTIGLAYAALPSYRDMQFMKPRKYTPTGYAVASAGADARLIDVTFVEESSLYSRLRGRG